MAIWKDNFSYKPRRAILKAEHMQTTVGLASVAGLNRNMGQGQEMRIQ